MVVVVVVLYAGPFDHWHLPRSTLTLSCRVVGASVASSVPQPRTAAPCVPFTCINSFNSVRVKRNPHSPRQQSTKWFAPSVEPPYELSFGLMKPLAVLSPKIIVASFRRLCLWNCERRFTVLQKCWDILRWSGIISTTLKVTYSSRNDCRLRNALCWATKWQRPQHGCGVSLFSGSGCPSKVSQ